MWLLAALSAFWSVACACYPQQATQSLEEATQSLEIATQSLKEATQSLEEVTLSLEAATQSLEEQLEGVSLKSARTRRHHVNIASTCVSSDILSLVLDL